MLYLQKCSLKNKAFEVKREALGKKMGWDSVQWEGKDNYSMFHAHMKMSPGNSLFPMH